MAAPASVAAITYQDILEHLPGVVRIDDLDLKPVYLSPQIEALLGYPAEEWLQDAGLWSRLLHPDDRKYTIAAYRNTVGQGAKFQADYRLLAKDGSLRWIHHRAALVREPSGEPVCIQGLMLDVSERQRAEQGLKESEARYRTLVETSPDAITVTDLEGRILMVNEQALHIYGVSSAGELVGRPSHDLVLLEDRDRFGASKEQVQSEGGARDLPYRLLRPDGTVVPVEVAASAIRDDDGEVVAFLAVTRDISERLETEELRRDKETQSRFLATMSHELRTPLNSILGFSQLLASGDFGSLNDRQRRYLENIETSGRHLHRLVSEILDLAGAASGQVRVALQPVELKPLLELCYGRHESAAATHGLSLALKRPRDVQVVADPVRLEQAVGVLLSNAIKFTPSGGTISISGRVTATHVRISVADSGIGIPQAEQARIFREFTQVDSGRSRGRDGAGMGLALCYRLVELMGGAIIVRSRPGHGSVFTITLRRNLPSPTPS